MEGGLERKIIGPRMKNDTLNLTFYAGTVRREKIGKGGGGRESGKPPEDVAGKFCRM